MILVEWLKRKKVEYLGPGGVFGPNLFIYNSLLGAVKQSGRYDLVEKFMNDMIDMGITPNVVTYNTLMAVYLEQGRGNEALDILDEIQRKGITLSPVTYSTTLLVYRKLEDGFGGLKFLVELRSKYKNGEIGNGGNVNWENVFLKLEKLTIAVCFHVMRRWLVSGGELVFDVLKLRKYRDDAKLQPEREEHERLVWACTDETHYVVAKEFYSRIRQNHSEISLSVSNHLIWLMGKAKKWWAALEPNLYAYTIMASICIGQGKFNLVDSVIPDMKASMIQRLSHTTPSSVLVLKMDWGVLRTNGLIV